MQRVDHVRREIGVLDELVRVVADPTDPQSRSCTRRPAARRPPAGRLAAAGVPGRSGPPACSTLGVVGFRPGGLDDRGVELILRLGRQHDDLLRQGATATASGQQISASADGTSSAGSGSWATGVSPSFGGIRSANVGSAASSAAVGTSANNWGG